MYQKNDEAVVPAAKESNFMERMYMKLENICVEADKNPSLLFQEAGKYFETQVSSAGANMRKLCSELIRDLLPPPEDCNISECKHADNCKCNKHKPPSSSPPSPPSVEQAPDNAPAAETHGSAAQTLQHDTEVEEGEQAAQWYVSDDYKRSSGIVDSLSASSNVVSSSKDAAAHQPDHESDSEEWEIV